MWYISTDLDKLQPWGQKACSWPVARVGGRAMRWECNGLQVGSKTLFFLNTSIYVVFNCIFHNWHCWWMKSCTSWLSHDSFFLNTSIYFVFNCIFIIDTVDGWNPAPVDCHMTLFFLNTSIYFVFNWIFHNWHCWWMESCTSWLSHDSLFLNTSIYVVFNMYIHNWHFLMVQKSCTSWYYIVGSWNPIIYRGSTHPWWLALGISSINRSMLWGLGSSWERAAEGCCPQQPSAVGESQRVKKQLFTETQSYMNQFFGLYVLCCINLCVCIDYR